LLSVEHLIAAIASDKGFGPREAHFECLNGPSALNGRNTSRAGYRLAPNDESRQQRPGPSGSGRGNNVPDLVPQPTIAQTIRNFLGPEAIEAIRNLDIAMRSDSDRATPGLEATNHDNEATDRENASRIYEDVAAIESRLKLLGSNIGKESTDILDIINSDYANQFDEFSTNPLQSDKKYFIGGNLGEYYILRTDWDQDSTQFPARRASDTGSLSFEAANYSESSSTSWPYVSQINANSSGPISSSGPAKATDGRSDFVAFVASLERLIFSPEALAYLIVISMLYLGFEGVRKMIHASRRSRRRRLRGGRHRRA